MSKMDGLRAGIAEMRSVAQRLNQWADDLEASFRGKDEEPTAASGGNIGGSEVSRNERAVRATVATIEAAASVAAEVPASEPGSAEKKKRTPKPVAAEPESAKEERKVLTLPEVRTVLAGKCAAGFGAQVRALIESYGASTLKEVPAEKYEELLEAVTQMGGDADAG